MPNPRIKTDWAFFDLAGLFSLSFGKHGLAVSPGKFLNSPCGIDKFLFTREKWVASCANADFDIPASRSCAIRRATCTNDRSLGVVGMNVRSHKKEREINTVSK
jgi:hypothetical protein